MPQTLNCYSQIVLVTASIIISFAVSFYFVDSFCASSHVCVAVCVAGQTQSLYFRSLWLISNSNCCLFSTDMKCYTFFVFLIINEMKSNQLGFCRSKNISILIALEFLIVHRETRAVTRFPEMDTFYLGIFAAFNAFPKSIFEKCKFDIHETKYSCAVYNQTSTHTNAHSNIINSILIMRPTELNRKWRLRFSRRKTPKTVQFICWCRRCALAISTTTAANW